MKKKLIWRIWIWYVEFAEKKSSTKKKNAVACEKFTDSIKKHFDIDL